MFTTDNFLSFNLVRLHAAYKEYIAAGKPTPLILDNLSLLDDMNVLELKDYLPDEHDTIDQFVNDVHKITTGDNTHENIVTVMMFKDTYRSLKTPKLKLVPDDVVNKYRNNINHIQALYMESNSVSRYILDRKRIPRKHKWLQTLLENPIQIRLINEEINHDIKQLKRFIVWYYENINNGNPATCIELYHVKKLIVDFNDWRRGIMNLVDLLKKL